MALSAAMQWALNNGLSEADVYKNINDFLATNPTAAQTQAQMAQYGISPEDVAAATGGKSGGMLSGNIMAGASWNSLNTALPSQLTQATGQQTSNYAVGGATTADTLKQLNTFLAGGGQFDPKSTVFLQTGGVDFIQGVDKNTVKDNINQIVKTLGDQGVNVVLTGSPYAASIQDVQTNNFNPEVDPIFKEIAKENKNVALVGTQGEILQNKDLLVDALHTNAQGTAIYNQSVIDALSQFKNNVPASTPQAIAQAQQTNTVATTNQNPLVKLYQDTLGRTPSQAEIDSWGFGNTIEPYELDKFLGAARNEATSTMPTTGAAANIAKQILAQGTSSQWTGQGYGSAEKNAYDMGVMLAGQGITDINQLGQTTVEVPDVDENGVPIKTTVTKFVNKATGQPLETYYDRASTIGPNIWGGTFAGKDSTAYGVQFDAAGKPIFYTQSGGDSSNIADYMPLIQMALLATGAGSALGSALLGSGASAVATGALGGGLLGAGTSALAGADWKKGALLGGAGGALGGYLQGLDGTLVPSLDAADTAGGLIPKFGTSYDDWMQLVMNNPEAQQALLNAINGTQVATTTAPVTTPTTTEGLFNVPSTDTVNITGTNVPTQVPPDILSAVTSQLSNNLTTTTPTVKVTAENPNKTVGTTVLPITSNLTTTNVVPNVEVTGTADKNKVTTPAVIPPAGTTTTTSTTSSDTSKDLTTEQKLNLAKAGLSLVGLLGGGAAAGGLLGGGGGGGTVGVGALPTQGVPINSDDYFQAIQRNYNALLPAMPRDVATPLRSWYNSQYGA